MDVDKPNFYEARPQCSPIITASKRFLIIQTLLLLGLLVSRRSANILFDISSVTNRTIKKA